MDEPVDRLAPLEELLGHRFTDRALLRRALRHGSAADGRGTYQRLEFLGDAVLGLVVARMLYDRFPFDDEGLLTRKRSHLIRSQKLAEIAALLGLDGWAEVGPSEQASGGRERSTLLEDLLEAVVGALAVDGGFEVARGFVEAHLAPELDELDERQLALANPKSALQEAAQARGLGLPEYREVWSGGADHDRRFAYVVLWGGDEIARGEGRSKRDAQQQAARRALARLGLVPEG